ncbi:flavin reductase [Marinomonas rhizomae]|uniref:Flavin reductase (DIM6/NTAB) family NADH-FMN oxidoreductase RutF n=1 Tax=Marinomonas rhizomae TaxID=491948 RepID=A0A366IWG3_9GAMM|nr:flavin reductase family protein [Marinomonas rhizomae]RBP79123.1 flavin reductase (DIM6/NTAB) family NADH-FMN oxidoreductase RutF [Marinomonas rhizomae]RNF70414.1 flavin reductase [Marinomonas rhizomae]
MSNFDVRELRNAFGSFMTGVTIVTAVSKTGEKVGFTANSFTSVSMDPPLLLVCPAVRLSSYDIFESCDHFAVSVLAEDQQHASNTFAGSKDDRFAEVEWHVDEFGTPLIDGAVAHFSCSSFQKVEAGDHLLLMGKVEQFSSNEKFGLGYAKGGYFSLGMEHKAEEIAHDQCAQVGALLECNGKLLLRKSDEGFSLPQGKMQPDMSSLQTLKSMLTSLDLTAEVGQVFSVYEKSTSGNFVAFYRAESTIEKDIEGYEYVAIEALSDVVFASSDITSMVNRFVHEKSNGVFRLYVGNELEGDVR